MPDEPENSQQEIEFQLLDILDQLRDAFNLAIECAMRDIRRLMKNKEDK